MILNMTLGIQLVYKENIFISIKYVIEFTKSYLDYCPALWYRMMLQGGALMKSMLEEMWYDNISPQTDSRKDIPEMKQLMG